MNESKTCRACGEARPAHEFNASSKTEDGLAARCRTCVNAARRQRARERKAVGVVRPASIRKASREGDVAAVERFFATLPDERREALLAFALDHAVADYRTVKKTARHGELVRKLVELGASPRPYLVCEAAKGGNRDLVDALLESGADFTLHAAAALGDVQAVQRSLQIDPKRASSIDESIDLRYGADRIERGGCTPLHYAAASGLGEADEEAAAALAEVAELLLAAGAIVDAPDRTGAKPMDHAVGYGGNPLLVRVLLAHGARFGPDDLFAALRQLQRRGKGQREVTEMIWQSGVVDREEVRRGGVHGHASQGMRKIVLWMLERGTEVDQRDQAGRTALHWVAQRQSSPRMARLLLDRGAALEPVDAAGKTPLDLALEHEKHDVAEFLRSRGATRVRA